MNRTVLGFILFTIILAGCSSPTESFKGNVWEIKTNGFIIDCTDEFNKGSKGAVNSVGVGCPVEYSDQTIIRNESGNYIMVGDISAEAEVKVVLEDPVDIKASLESSKPLVLKAKEIILSQ